MVIDLKVYELEQILECLERFASEYGKDAITMDCIWKIKEALKKEIGGDRGKN